jgi:transcriptional regulator with XRE-family HTH domain
MRQRRGLTQEALARAVGLPVSLITALEDGSSFGMPVRTCDAIARALGVSRRILPELKAETSQRALGYSSRW